MTMGTEGRDEGSKEPTRLSGIGVHILEKAFLLR